MKNVNLSWYFLHITSVWMQIMITKYLVDDFMPYMHEEVRSSVLNKVGKYSEPNYNFINSRILIKNKLILIKTKQNKKSMLLNNINNNRITY